MAPSKPSDTSRISAPAWLPPDLIYEATSPTSTSSSAPSSTSLGPAHPTIVFSLASLADVPEEISDDELFDALMARCEPWVGPHGDAGYTMIILSAEESAMATAQGGRRRARGRSGWVWRWRRIPRNFRKNLKRLYIVHPSFFTRAILGIVLPFLSPKAYRKIFPLQTLSELYTTHHVSLGGLHLNLPTLEQEGRIRRDRPDLFPEAPEAHKARYPDPIPNGGGGWWSGLRSVAGTAAGYLPYAASSSSSTTLVPESNGPESASKSSGEKRRGLWGRDLDELVCQCGGVPVVVEQMSEAILTHCSSTENIFRSTPGPTLRPPIIALLDVPIDDQPGMPWAEISRADPYVTPKLLMRLFSSAEEPVFPASLYPLIRSLQSPTDITDRLIPRLSHGSTLLLTHMMRLFHALSTSHEASTRMSARSYAIVFAPDLIRGPNELDDLEMCLERGKSLPPALRATRTKLSPEVGGGASGDQGGDNTLVGVLEMLISNYPALAGQTTQSAERPGQQQRKSSGSVHELLRAVEGRKQGRPSLPETNDGL